MKKIRLSSPLKWRAGETPRTNTEDTQVLREQLLREINELRVQLRADDGAGTSIDTSRRQTYKDMINSRRRLYQRLQLDITPRPRY